jgi:hypothetical protein
MMCLRAERGLDQLPGAVQQNGFGKGAPLQLWVATHTPIGTAVGSRLRLV